MKDTDIQWADSSLNLMMGCGGCELWTAKERRCYAGILTRRYGGGKGWPVTFEQPTMFPERLAPALKWPDLTGKDRPNKPWLDGSIHPKGGSGPHNRVSWVVIGGESGSDARPTNLSWIEALIAQCQNEGAAIFVKQLGSSPVRVDDSLLKLKDSKGGDMAKWPARLAIRQMMVSAQLNVPFAAAQGILL